VGVDVGDFSGITAVQVMPMVGQSTDYEEEQMENSVANEAKNLDVQLRSLSLSPVSGADISEPETELEEDQESKPYNRPFKNKNQRRPHSNPSDNNSSGPNNVSALSYAPVIKQTIIPLVKRRNSTTVQLAGVSN
jgi:hypothetical protein